VEGEYTVFYQLSNPYSESQILSESLYYIPLAEIDVILPTTPEGLVASNITPTGLTLSWNPSIDAHLDSYNIYNLSELYGSTTGTSIVITGLTKETTYSFTVEAKDRSNNVSELSTPLVVTTTAEVFINTLIGNVIIAQVFSPSSTIVNIQDGVTIDRCFITLYNKNNHAITLDEAKLYWKYDAYPVWNQVNLSGTIQPHKHFLITGSKLTGIIDGTTILTNWQTAVPDLNCTVDWSQFVDPDPTNTEGLSDRMIQWALTQNLFYLASKTGVVYLSDKAVDPLTLNTNP